MKKGAKHTPGPWVLSEDHVSAIYGAPVDGRSYGVVAKTSEYIDPRDSQEANARLISAAPELLEVCKIALDALGCDRLWQDRLEAQRAIRAAMRKATGSPPCVDSRKD